MSIIPDKKKSDNKYLKAIGLMSGTSMDGIDVALIESDGFSVKKENKFLFLPYSKIFQKTLRELINNPSLNSKLSLDATKQITKIHIEAVQKFIKKYNLDYKHIDLIGFHGHTILHRPDQKLTWQIGDSSLLEKVLNIKVISDLRNIDIKNGGQGAPLAPIYHHALLKDCLSEEVIFMNIGGVVNITYVTEGARDLIAGDICFGNAPMDDLVYKKLGKNFDKNGEIAKSGKIDLNLSDEFLRLEFFKRSFPKSIDRNEFSSYLGRFDDLELSDALASLVDIMSKSLKKSLDLLPKKPTKIIISGGGAKNIFLLEKIAEITGLEILNAKNFNINIDSVEAELFAFLAIRNFYNLPLSYAKL